MASKKYTRDTNFSRFGIDKTIQLLYIRPSVLIDVITKYDSFKITEDNFIIGYTHNTTTFNQLIYNCFDIKSSHCSILRKCPECGVINTLDGETWDNYADYCKLRKILSKKIVFKLRFFFDCDHPIEPNKDIIISKKTSTICVS